MFCLRHGPLRATPQPSAPPALFSPDLLMDVLEEGEAFLAELRPWLTAADPPFRGGGGGRRASSERENNGDR